MLAAVCILILHLTVDRSRSFRAQAQRGQPIVRAIEQFKKHTGGYPGSLAILSPEYLPTPPETPNEADPKSKGWDYYLVTNGSMTTFRLSYYMGKGGVYYQPPRWVGNDEGHESILTIDED